MNAMMNFLERYFLPIATRIGTQKHLVAVRDGFISTLPVTMAGSLAVLLNVFVRDFPRNFGWDGVVDFMRPVIQVNGFVWGGSLAIMAVIFAVTLGANLAKAYEVDPLPGSIVSLAAFFMGLSQSATTTLTLSSALPADAAALITEAGGTIVTNADGAYQITAGAWGFFNFGAQMGGPGLFTALIFGLISTIIFCKLMRRNLVIKLPDSVPPAVAKAFAAIIPASVALYVVGLINFLFVEYVGMSVFNWIYETIQAPLLGLSQGFGAVILLVFLVHLLWFFGLHGTNILAPIFQTIYGTAMNENINAFQTGAEIPWLWTAGSFEAFVWPTGAGVTMMLIVANLIFSKRADSKTVSKLALAPGIFNINEPVMFGMPIVLNPLYMIPFILAPLVTTSIAYFATVMGLVNPVVVNVLWVMPAGVSGFLATGGDWRAIILTLINLAAAFVIWVPFVIAANKAELAD